MKATAATLLDTYVIVKLDMREMNHNPSLIAAARFIALTMGRGRGQLGCLRS